MSKKTLNAANLQSLGAERLAALLIEVSSGSAEIKRRLRLELSYNLGANELSADVRKRLATLRKSRTWVSWRKRKTLVKDLQVQSEMITDRIARDDPAEAFALLWIFLELAPSIFARVDDARGEVAEVFTTAIARFPEIAPHAQVGQIALADRIWDAIQEDNYGLTDTLVPLLALSLGQEGLDRLRANATAQMDTPEPQAEHDAIRFLRDLRGAGRMTPAQRQARHILQQVADLSGDVDGYIALFSPAQRSHPETAADIATRLLEVGRADEALEMLQDAQEDGAAETSPAWDAAYLATLDALGEMQAAQSYRWARFEQDLSLPHLRAHIAKLPDFDDIDAEDRAKSFAASFPDATLALSFFLGLPDLAGAAQLVESRLSEIDADAFTLLDPAADQLEARFPLASVLLRRAMVEFDLTYARASRFQDAAAHLVACRATEAMITDHGPHDPHSEWEGFVQDRFARRSAFWKAVSDLS